MRALTARGDVERVDGAAPSPFEVDPRRRLLHPQYIQHSRAFDAVTRQWSDPAPADGLVPKSLALLVAAFILLVIIVIGGL